MCENFPGSKLRYESSPYDRNSNKFPADCWQTHPERSVVDPWYWTVCRTHCWPVSYYNIFFITDRYICSASKVNVDIHCTIVSRSLLATPNCIQSKLTLKLASTLLSNRKKRFSLFKAYGSCVLVFWAKIVQCMLGILHHWCLSGSLSG